MNINLVDISTPNPQSKDLNERLVNNINDLGIIYINADVDLVYYLFALFTSLFLSTAIYFLFKGVKYVVIDERDHIVAEIKSCSRFIVQKCLDDDEFRSISLKLVGGVLVFFSIVGFAFGSTMLGFCVGVVVLLSFFYEVQKTLLEQETQLINGIT